jgi:hypothetical protein
MYCLNCPERNAASCFACQRILELIVGITSMACASRSIEEQCICQKSQLPRA